MRTSFVHVLISSSVSGIRVLIPQRSTANPFEWTPCPRRTLLRLLLYYELVRLPCRHTSSLPLRLVGSFVWERHGSPKFRCKPLDDLPWTQTPARRDALTNPRVAVLASRENNLWPICDDENLGAQYLHLRYGRPSAIPLASRNSLPPHVQSSVQARWLTFGPVGLSN